MSFAKFPATRLEIDESIIHSQLKINTEDDEIQHFIDAAMAEREKNQAPNALPYKTVKPKPGYCVKTKNLITSQKIFINICHTDIIPAPAVDLSESELTKILESDEPSSFRIPMSLGESHDEVDKSGKPCTVYDVAINSTFYSKVESSLLFQTFLITISMEGLEDKYTMELDKNGWNILKNRRCFGTIKNHRIEQRHEKPIVQEVPKSSLLKDPNQKLIEEVEDGNGIGPKSVGQQTKLEAKYTLVSTRGGIKVVVARLPVQENVEDLSLSVITQNSLSVTSRLDGRNIVNVTFPHSVEPAKSRAVFNKTTKILTVLLPLI